MWSYWGLSLLFKECLVDIISYSACGSTFRCIVQRLWTALSRVYLFGFGFQWIHTKGQPADMAEAPILVVAPHSSFLDMWIVAQHHIPTFVSKAEIRNASVFGCRFASCGSFFTQCFICHPLLSTYSLAPLLVHTGVLERACRLILVSREDSESCSKAAEEVRRRAHSGAGWPKVLVFAEGNC